MNTKEEFRAYVECHGAVLVDASGWSDEEIEVYRGFEQPHPRNLIGIIRRSWLDGLVSVRAEIHEGKARAALAGQRTSYDIYGTPDGVKPFQREKDERITDMAKGLS